MIALLQRVSEASVSVEEELLGSIEQGIMVLLAVQPEDTVAIAQRMIDRLLGYRVFEDESGRMNLSVTSIQGEVLLVPQFTLAANTQKGTRPSFSSCAPPEQANSLFDEAFAYLQAQHECSAKGRFGADMQVHLINDGPVTFQLVID